MKITNLTVILVIFLTAAPALAQTTAFNFQGRLNDVRHGGDRPLPAAFIP